MFWTLPNHQHVLAAAAAAAEPELLHPKQPVNQHQLVSQYSIIKLMLIQNWSDQNERLFVLSKYSPNKIPVLRFLDFHQPEQLHRH